MEHIAADLATLGTKNIMIVSFTLREASSLGVNWSSPSPSLFSWYIFLIPGFSSCVRIAFTLISIYVCRIFKLAIFTNLSPMRLMQCHWDAYATYTRLHGDQFPQGMARITAFVVTVVPEILG